jgi:hypothetical protein
MQGDSEDLVLKINESVTGHAGQYRRPKPGWAGLGFALLVKEPDGDTYLCALRPEAASRSGNDRRFASLAAVRQSRAVATRLRLRTTLCLDGSMGNNAVAMNNRI